MTISPGLLEELEKSTKEFTPRLTAAHAATLDLPKVTLNEAAFRWEMNQDPMATEKLSEGIRKFGEDGVKLENQLAALLKK